MARPTITLCAIVRNEERSLPRCLQSVSELVSEMVVADTGSTDQTPSIASELGAQVFQYPWSDNFAEARNACIDLARGDWILVLDGDEYLEQESHEVVRQAVQVNEIDAWQLTIRNFLPDGDLENYEDVPVTRLFRRRAGFRYQGAIHEQIMPSIIEAGGKVAAAEAIIFHTGYATSMDQSGRTRAERNLRLLRKLAQDNPSDPYLRFHIGATRKALGLNQQAYDDLRAVADSDPSILGFAVLKALYMKLAQLALGLERRREATHFALECLKFDRDNMVCHNILALCSLFTFNFRQALHHLTVMQRSGRLQQRHMADVEALMAFCRNQMLHPRAA